MASETNRGRDVTGISIDLLPVGTGSKSGDSIVIQYGDDFFRQTIIVDGGSLAAGDAVVKHISDNFGPQTVIEHMICTHQDADHASGLRRIIQNFKVQNLWVHQPWLYANELVGAFRHRWSAEGLRRHLREDCFPIVASLCDLAEEYGIPLRQPLQGVAIGPLRVLAPSIDRFLELVPQMGQTPAARSLAEDGMFASMIKSVKEAVLNTVEGWGFETLSTPAPNATSVTNETSVVLYGEFNGQRMLLTGDAGVGALQDAIEGAARHALPIWSPDFIQVPHHGSRRNVSPELLDVILGKKQLEGEARRGSAVSSVSTGAIGFPRKVVENAFNRRGYDPYSTKQGMVNWTVGMSKRPNLHPLSPSPFHSVVED